MHRRRLLPSGTPRPNSLPAQITSATFAGLEAAEAENPPICVAVWAFLDNGTSAAPGDGQGQRGHRGASSESTLRRPCGYACATDGSAGTPVALSVLDGGVRVLRSFCRVPRKSRTASASSRRRGLRSARDRLTSIIQPRSALNSTIWRVPPPRPAAICFPVLRPALLYRLAAPHPRPAAHRIVQHVRRRTSGLPDLPDRVGALQGRHSPHQPVLPRATRAWQSQNERYTAAFR